MPTRRGSFAVNDDVEVPKECCGPGQFMVHDLPARTPEDRRARPRDVRGSIF
ncbi:hypothetical protein ACFTXB_14170 [Streptomyces sp. NPDC057074]|uniref:hypothetical protein n=1 Tax=Streptomyces sp. NPDC057074 TaxID=3346015 RepID=UPI00363C8463